MFFVHNIYESENINWLHSQGSLILISYVFIYLVDWPLLNVCFRFIRVGGYKLLNVWLTYARNSNNSPLLHRILLTLQHLPLTVDHLKQVKSLRLMFWSFICRMQTLILCYIIYSSVLNLQNNTAKLVKQLSKTSEDEGMVHSLCWFTIVQCVSCIWKYVYIFLIYFFNLRTSEGSTYTCQWLDECNQDPE